MKLLFTPNLCRFLWALFLFDIGLVLWTAIARWTKSSAGWQSVPALDQDDEMSFSAASTGVGPSLKPSHDGPHYLPMAAAAAAARHEKAYSSRWMRGAVVALMAGLGTGSFLIRTVFPIGYWLPAVFPGFQASNY